MVKSGLADGMVAGSLSPTPKVIQAGLFIGTRWRHPLRRERGAGETGSPSRGPARAVMTVRTTGKNQRGEVVCTFKRSMLIPERGHAVEDRMGTY